MGENFDMVAPQVQEHVKKLVASTGMPDTEESLEINGQGLAGKAGQFSRAD
jgi:hypothetical protein